MRAALRHAVLRCGLLAWVTAVLRCALLAWVTLSGVLCLVGCELRLRPLARGGAGAPLHTVTHLRSLCGLGRPSGCRWAEAMAAQGSGGAFEISQRMTAMVSVLQSSEFPLACTQAMGGCR